MKKFKLIGTMLLMASCPVLFGQSVETIRNYINQFRQIAIEEEIRTGVPAAITLAQGIHETGAGTSDLVLASNNHFGIKCKEGWTGGTVYHDDDAKGECFRKYDDPVQSYHDHSDFLKNRPYYATLFNLDPTDYKAWAYGLKKAGYATNPLYASILIRIIETYQLQEYTLLALGKKPDAGAVLASNSDVDISLASQRGNEILVPDKQEPTYPSGVFRINETKVIFVVKGTSYLKIANENDISLSRLFEFNEMKSADIAALDELLFLQRKRRSGAVAYHIIRTGETLHDIAQIEGVRLENLMEYNHVQENMPLQAGQQLILQRGVISVPKMEKTVQLQ